MNIYTIIITLLFLGASFIIWKLRNRNSDARVTQLKRKLNLKEKTIRDQILLIDKLQEKIDDIKTAVPCDTIDDAVTLPHRLRKYTRKNKHNK